MHPNARSIERFYTALGALDAEAMASAYHPEKIHFTDRVFDLHGAEVPAMWRMLVERARDFRLEFRGVEADERTGRAHWEAWYTFSKTGRPVHNVLEATFTFENGAIVRHVDTFDLWRWSRMALGPTGALLGWTPFVQKKIRAEANAGLRHFMSK